ncbi:MAG: type II toxin-antitoxin system HicB family antitoxin [Caldilineales bacterium]|nr:type II toxin-antitoxin system HicB family antitoxin [Caldilineales bacterium]
MHQMRNGKPWSELPVISIFYSEEDGGYIADIPDLRYCSAFGRTPDEALREVQIAKEAWIETAKASGKPIPKPLYRPVIYQLAA